MASGGSGASGASGASRLFLVVFLAFALGAVLAWESFGSTLGPTFFYPAAGVTASAMMLSRRALWPAVIAAILVAEILVDTYFGSPPWVSIGFAAANMVEPIVGASLTLAWCAGKPDLRKRSDFAAFIAGACAAGPFFGALIGGTVSSNQALTPWLSTVVNWWAGDALGVLVVASPILLWSKQRDIVLARRLEALGVLAATSLLTIAAFWTEAPPSFLILPVLAWAALRLDMIGAAMAGAVAALLANIMATRGHGLFSTIDVSLPLRVALTQVFVAVVVVVSMLVAQEASGRLAAVRSGEADRRERKRLETLSRLAQQLSAALTPDDIGAALTEHVLNDAGAMSLALGLVTPDGDRLEWVTMAGFPPAVLAEFGDGVAISVPSVVTDAVRNGQPILVPSASDYLQRYRDNVHWLQISQTESVVGWPLTSGKRPIGTLLLGWSEAQPLNEAQLAYIAAVAALAGQALMRARAFVDEVADAAVLQSAVLPINSADTPGLQVYVTSEFADLGHSLAGDWYDVMALPGKRTYLAVGDVAGHGLPAIEDMAQVRSAGRALAHQGLPPARLLTEVNGFTRHVSHGKFATMAVVIADSDEGALSYCLAGHPVPLLRRAGTGEVIALADASGPVLGHKAQEGYADASLRVEKDDLLVMYTDGLVEHDGLAIEDGIARVRRAIADWDCSTPVAELCRELLESLAPSGGGELCILAVRFAEVR
ncbi:MAG: SpoIIE family protein phosphatase [Mycobacterium sp.]|nr:SpoIIE family protein phosphatase [Mycobacterium sp.]